MVKVIFHTKAGKLSVVKGLLDINNQHCTVSNMSLALYELVIYCEFVNFCLKFYFHE